MKWWEANKCVTTLQTIKKIFFCAFRYIFVFGHFLCFITYLFLAKLVFFYLNFIFIFKLFCLIVNV